jgi:hypothetical protein
VKAQYLPDRLTLLTPVLVTRAIRSAFETLEGVTPIPQCTAIHVAQSGGETWRWKSLHHYNLDNTKAGEQYEGLYTCFRCDEQLSPGVWKRFIPEGELVGAFGSPLKYAPLPVPEGHPQTRFRAYNNLEFAALAHMQLLKRKWPEAYTSARVGDVAGFVHGLKMRNFFTADEGPYLKLVSSLYREWLPLALQPERDTIPAPPDDEDELHCQGMACVAPDPDRALHSEAVVAYMLGQEGMWDAVNAEKRRNLAEE